MSRREDEPTGPEETCENGERLGHRESCGNLEVEGLRHREARPPHRLSQCLEGQGQGRSVVKLLGNCKECAAGGGAGSL